MRHSHDSSQPTIRLRLCGSCGISFERQLAKCTQRSTTHAMEECEVEVTLNVMRSWTLRALVPNVCGDRVLPHSNRGHATAKRKLRQLVLFGSTNTTEKTRNHAHVSSTRRAGVVLSLRSRPPPRNPQGSRNGLPWQVEGSTQLVAQRKNSERGEEHRHHEDP